MTRKSRKSRKSATVAEPELTWVEGYARYMAECVRENWAAYGDDNDHSFYRYTRMQCYEQTLDNDWEQRAYSDSIPADATEADRIEVCELVANHLTLEWFEADSYEYED